MSIQGQIGRLKIILTALALVVLLDVGGVAWRWGPLGVWLLILAECGLGIALLLCHAVAALGARRAVAFVLLAGVLGWLAEAVSLHSPLSLFGGRYEYHFVGPHVAGVPLPIPTFWGIFIYGGYAVSNSFLRWLGRDKPRREAGDGRRLGPLILLDGVLVVLIDLVLDPIQVQAGRWTWSNGGPYFGVPLGNFVGWFIVVAASSAAFRLFEYHRPAPSRAAAGRVHALIAPICYGLFAGVLILWALGQAQWPMALLAVAWMGPVVAVNGALYRRHLRRGK